jgi:transcriptional regulator with XRE-family HTH domain
LLYSKSCRTLGVMSISFSYNVKAPHVPVWTLSDRLRKTRADLRMNCAQFAAHTGLTARQIHYAESGRNKTSDVLITVVAAKTGVDYWWLKTGNAPILEKDQFVELKELLQTFRAGKAEEKALLLGLDSNQEPIGSSSLPGLDSNQEPFGSFLDYQIRRLERGRGLKYLERSA